MTKYIADRADARMVSAALSLYQAQRDLADAQQEFNDAADDLRRLGRHLDPNLMEISGSVPGDEGKMSTMYMVEVDAKRAEQDAVIEQRGFLRGLEAAAEFVERTGLRNHDNIARAIRALKTAPQEG